MVEYTLPKIAWPEGCAKRFTHGRPSTKMVLGKLTVPFICQAIQGGGKKDEIGIFPVEPPSFTERDETADMVVRILRRKTFEGWKFDVNPG